MAQQAQQVEKGLFIAAVRGGGKQHHVALRVFCQTFEQLITLLAALATLSAGVGFVHDDKFRAKALEGFAPTFGLDVVQADDCEGVGIKHRGARRQVTLQPVGAGAAHHDGLDVEALFQFALPLLAQVGRAQHRHALDFAPVEHLTGYQGSFNRFADTYVVGNQQAHGRELHGHEQRHQLVGTGLHCDIAKAAERASAAAQLELQGIHQQLTGRVVTGLLDGGPRKGGGPHRLGLQRQVDKGFVLLTTAQGTQAQGIGGGLGQHYPFTATGRDETAGVKTDLHLFNLRSCGFQPD